MTTLREYARALSGKPSGTSWEADAYNLMGGRFAKQLGTLQNWQIEALDRWRIGTEVFFFVDQSEYIDPDKFWAVVQETFAVYPAPDRHSSPTWDQITGIDRYWKYWKDTSGYSVMESFILMNLPGDDFDTDTLKALDKRIDINEICRLTSIGLSLRSVVEALDNEIDIDLLQSLTEGSAT